MSVYNLNGLRWLRKCFRSRGGQAELGPGAQLCCTLRSSPESTPSFARSSDPNLALPLAARFLPHVIGPLLLRRTQNAPFNYPSFRIRSTTILRENKQFTEECEGRCGGGFALFSSTASCSGRTPLGRGSVGRFGLRRFRAKQKPTAFGTRRSAAWLRAAFAFNIRGADITKTRNQERTAIASESRPCSPSRMSGGVNSAYRRTGSEQRRSCD